MHAYPPAAHLYCACCSARKRNILQVFVVVGLVGSIRTRQVLFPVSTKEALNWIMDFHFQRYDSSHAYMYALCIFACPGWSIKSINRNSYPYAASRKSTEPDGRRNGYLAADHNRWNPPNAEHFLLILFPDGENVRSA